MANKVNGYINVKDKNGNVQTIFPVTKQENVEGLSEALAASSSAVSALAGTVDKKVDKVSGKGLSSNDFTTSEKNKLAGIAEGANKTVVDTSLSASSKNPIANSTVNAAILSANAAINSQSSSLSSVSAGLELANARIDNFTTLPTGSTTGDAELADGRIDFYGKTHQNIGGAIRNQIAELNKNISSLNVAGDASYLERLHYHNSHTISDSVYRKYLKYGFIVGQTYRIVFKLNKFTPKSTASVALNIRTTKDESTANICDNISSEHDIYMAKTGEYVWYFRPVTAEGIYIYIFLQCQINTTLDYDIYVQEAISDYAMIGSNSNINTTTSEDICNNNLDNLPNNRIFGVSITNDSVLNAPTQDFRGQIITYGKKGNVRTTSDTQVFVHNSGDIYVRIYYPDWGNWIKIATSNNTITYLENTAVLSANCNKLLANINEPCIILAHANEWDDRPTGTDGGGGVLINQQYSVNYNIQQFTAIKSGNKWERITKKDGTIYRNWTQINGLAPMKILALGDSICYGYRNENKGFVGDLGLPYKNIGVSSATLSNKVTSVKNIPQQLIDELEYDPDIIIANGGINDYTQNAPLGVIPNAPAVTDSEANALDRSTVAGGIGYLFFTMIKKYPKAQRFFVITHKIQRWDKPDQGYPYYPTTQNEQGYTQQDLHDVIVKMCEIYNVKVIDVYKDGIINTRYKQYVSEVDYSADSEVTYTNYVNRDCVHPLDYGYREGYVPLVRQAIGIGTAK